MKIEDPIISLVTYQVTEVLSSMIVDFLLIINSINSLALDIANEDLTSSLENDLMTPKLINP